MSKKTLLVMIDDDTDDHEIFKMAIQDINDPIDCLYFTDCESAIAHFSQKSAAAPKFVFIDLRLPRINGDQCLEQLHQLRQFNHPLLVIYSSSIPDHWRDRLSQLGVDKFVEKTDSITDLTSHIQQLISAE